jgi:sulfur carrier protein ThiS
VWQIEIEEGFSLEDLLAELGTLEEKALGEKVHGG